MKLFLQSIEKIALKPEHIHKIADFIHTSNKSINLTYSFLRLLISLDLSTEQQEEVFSLFTTHFLNDETSILTNFGQDFSESEELTFSTEEESKLFSFIDIKEVYKIIPHKPPKRPLIMPEAYIDFGKINSGGMAEIRRVLDRRFNRSLAMKIMHEDLCRWPKAIKLFIEEAQIISQLQHPNIIPVHDLGKL